MYNPRHFQEKNEKELLTLIERNGFGMLISVMAGKPVISHLPLLLKQDASGTTRLAGHVARANPHWQVLATSPEVTAVFEGPHTYISPSWYQHPGVPTWNYAVAHVYGKARIIAEPEKAWSVVSELTAKYESGRRNPWQPDWNDASQRRMVDAIVAFEIDIERIDGKFKMSQNRPAADQLNVIARLEQGSPMDQAVAALMKQQRAREGQQD